MRLSDQSADTAALASLPVWLLLATNSRCAADGSHLADQLAVEDAAAASAAGDDSRAASPSDETDFDIDTLLSGRGYQIPGESPGEVMHRLQLATVLALHRILAQPLNALDVKDRSQLCSQPSIVTRSRPQSDDDDLGAGEDSGAHAWVGRDVESPARAGDAEAFGLLQSFRDAQPALGAAASAANPVEMRAVGAGASDLLESMTGRDGIVKRPARPLPTVADWPLPTGVAVI